MKMKPKSPKLKKLRISITKKMSNDYNMIASCHHEAAHTITALANLILIDNVLITGGDGGDTNYFIYEADEDDGLKHLMVMSELKTIYAGLVGEKIYYKHICGSNKFPIFLRDGSYMDTGMGSAIIRKYKLASPGKETSDLKNEVKKGLDKFLNLYWEDVKLLAHSLYRKKKLNFSELKYLLTRSSTNKDFWKDKFKKIKIIYDEKKDLSEKKVKNLISSKV